MPRKSAKPCGRIPCPVCGEERTQVYDSRGSGQSKIKAQLTPTIVRRRRCAKGHKFTTYETYYAPSRRNLKQIDDMIAVLEKLKREIDPVSDDREIEIDGGAS